MKLLIINPNTSDNMTNTAKVSAMGAKDEDTKITVISAPYGPVTLEGYFDEMLSTIAVLEVIQKEKANYDAFIIACFSNHPAIYAARQLTPKPVLGIMLAPLTLACFLGAKFSIVSTSDRWGPLLKSAVHDIGMNDRCASVRMTGMDVEELDKKSNEELEEIIAATARRAIKEDGAEVIVLGCCGMAGMDTRLSKELGVPVIDPVSAAVKIAEILIKLNLNTSQILSYAPVLPREQIGVPEIFADLYSN